MVAKQISYNQIRTFKKPCKGGFIVHTDNESFGRFLGNKNNERSLRKLYYDWLIGVTTCVNINIEYYILFKEQGIKIVK